MESDNGLRELLVHLGRTTGLGADALARLVDEVTAYFDESVEHFVARRHRELKAEELKNATIFERIDRELRTRRFAAPPLTPRQLRRLVYG